MAPHAHGNHHHEEHDYAEMYKQDWVQEHLKSLDQFLKSHAKWLGIDSSKPQRVLDYACGNGTVSKAFIPDCPRSVFRGIDNSAAQAQRFNNASAEILGEQGPARMFAVHDDLASPSPAIASREWHGFDLAITSMALHHFAAPKEMLVQLAARLREEGTLVVIEFCRVSEAEKEKTAPAATPVELKESDLIETLHGDKIWPGFTARQLDALMEAAGCTDVESIMGDKVLQIPWPVNGKGGEMVWVDHYILISRGRVGKVPSK